MNSNFSIPIHKKDTNSLDAIKDIAYSKNQDSSFYVCDINDIVKKYKIWMEVMPTIKPYYAVKCNNHLAVLQILAALGTGFDCASKFEIEQVLSLGVSPDRIIFAHPTKLTGHIAYAAKVNVDFMTFDNEFELYKMKIQFPQARTILRIRYDDPEAQVVLGSKFGCEPNEEASQLLEIAKMLDINVVGVSFHVGSGCKDPLIFYQAIAACKTIFNIGKDLGFNFTILDIGGGFLGKLDDSIYEFGQVINEALEQFFTDDPVEVISEPGTYFVDSAFTLACNVHSIRHVAKIDPDTGKSFTEYMYYLNDGAYGSFNGIVSWDEDRNPFTIKDTVKSENYPSILWGPTADSCDKILDNIYLPRLEYNDCVVFPNMGSYSLSLVTSFHGFKIPDVYHIIDSTNWSRLQNELEFVDMTQI